MIRFTCPHCQSTMDVEPRYAGSSGPCRDCGKTITIPGGAPTGPTFTPTAKKGGVGFVAVLVLCGVGLLAGPILIALLLPAVQQAREAARRNGCINNQKQIAIALLNYESANGSFPPAYTVDENGNPMHSWRVLILPQLGEQALYSQFNLEEPWDSPQNMAAAQMIPAVYQCPSSTNVSATTATNYLAFVSPNTVLRPATSPDDKGTMLREIRDGTSKTLMIAESTAGVPWTEPTDIDPNDTSNIGSDHAGVYMATMADASVRAMTNNTLTDGSLAPMAHKSDGQ